MTLKKQRSDGNFAFLSPKETVNAIINPWTTKEDGKFVYLVPPGKYQLEVEHPDYIFPFDPKQLNPNYSKAYYELYYGPGFTDKTIIEEKTIEHRDIPLMPKKEPYRTPVKLLGYMTELDKEKMIYKISGRTSHPLTIVEIQGKNIQSGETTRVLSRVNADKWGFFDVNINTNILKQNETIGSAKLTKVDLTQEEVKISSKPSLFLSFLERFFTVLPRSSSYAKKEKEKIISFATAPINPLLNYLEGYAYDEDNKPLTQTKIAIYLAGSKKPYYQTQTDEKGFFLITSQHLPQMNYVIVYTTKQGVVRQITQKEFLQENAERIITDKINLNKYVTRLSPFRVQANEKFTERSAEKDKMVKNLSTNKISDNNVSSTAKNTKNKTLLFFVIVIFIFFIFLLTGLFIFLKKKN